MPDAIAILELKMHSGWNQVFNHVADLKKRSLEEKKFAPPSISLWHYRSVKALASLWRLEIDCTVVGKQSRALCDFRG